MNTQDIIFKLIAGLISVGLTGLLLWFLWIWPIRAGIRLALAKNISSHWMWFGIHPVGAWIAYAVLKSASPIKECPNCTKKSKSYARVCGYCGHQFTDEVSPSAKPATPMSSTIEPLEIQFRTSRSIQFKTSKSIEDCGKIIISIIQTNGGKIKVGGKNAIVAGFGSQLKIRLLGAVLAGANSFPRDVLVFLKANGDKTEIKITNRDTMGFGSRIGFEDKIQKLMYQNALTIKGISKNPFLFFQ